MLKFYKKSVKKSTFPPIYEHRKLSMFFNLNKFFRCDMSTILCILLNFEVFQYSYRLRICQKTLKSFNFEFFLNKVMNLEFVSKSIFRFEILWRKRSKNVCFCWIHSFFASDISIILRQWFFELFSSCFSLWEKRAHITAENKSC